MKTNENTNFQRTVNSSFKKGSVPVYSHTSPKNSSFKQESINMDKDASTTQDNGYKNFVIESSAGHTTSNKKEDTIDSKEEHSTFLKSRSVLP